MGTLDHQNQLLQQGAGELNLSPDLTRHWLGFLIIICTIMTICLLKSMAKLSLQSFRTNTHLRLQCLLSIHTTPFLPVLSKHTDSFV